MDELQELCQAYVAWLESAAYNEDTAADWQRAIFELAMELAMGADVWARVYVAMSRFEKEVPDDPHD